MAARLQAVYPLTPLQQGLLFHTLEQSQGTAYMVQWQADLQGPLDASALRQAWASVVARHPALRTGFAWERRDRPVQAVVSEVALPWIEEDWSGTGGEPWPARWSHLLQSDRQLAFELTRAPLMRWHLVRLGKQHHRLLWTSHHLILDGWSTSIVLRDVLSAYQREIQESPPSRSASAPDPQPPAFQQHVQWLADQPVEAAQQWWREHLGDSGGACNLGHLNRGHSVASSAAAALHLEASLGSDDTAALQKRARLLGVTEATMALGAFLLVLQRLSGTARPTVGLTHAGRPPSEPHAEEMVGLFINTVPLVAPRVQPWQPARVWLQTLQSTQAASVHHGHLALTDLRRLSPLSGSLALFEQLFVFENYPDAAALPPAEALGGLKVEILPGWEDPDQALTLVVAPGEAWTLRWIADPQRHVQAALERLNNALLQTLRRMAYCPADAALSAWLEVPSSVASTGGSPHPPLPATTLWRAFEEAAVSSPRAVALQGRSPGDKPVTYAALHVHALRWAAELRRRGVGVGDRVALVSGAQADFLAALLGILHRGAVYVPLDPELPGQRLQATLRDAGISIVLCESPLAREPGLTVVELHTVSATQSPSPAPDAALLLAAGPAAPVDAHATAYIMYTSGSTGEPKGVAVPQQAVLRLVALGGPMALRPGMRVAWASALSFDASTLELWTALAHGGTLVPLDRTVLTDPPALAQALPGLKLDLLWLTAGLFHLIVQAQPQALEAVETVIAGGDALDPSLVDHLLSHGPPQRLLNGYGPTENTTFSTVADLRQAPPVGEQAVPIGQALPGTELWVLDENGLPVEPGISGELHVGGLGLAQGYWGRAALTAEAFVPHPAPREPGERLYRTGDWVHWSADGRLIFDGRRDAQLKIRGHRVEALGVQALLAQAPGVRLAQVTVRRDGSGQWQLLAAVQAEPPQRADGHWADQVQRWLSERLASWSLPARLWAVEGWPLNLNGKVDWAALAEQAEAVGACAGAAVFDASVPDADGGDAAGFGDAAPSSADEQLLCSLWSALLGLSRVDRRTHFFEAGGHSLLATMLMARVRQAFGVDLPLRTLFDAPVLFDFLGHVRRARLPQEATQIMPLSEPVGGATRTEVAVAPLSFAQQRLWFLDRYAPLSAAYHIPHALRLTGTLDITALQAAVDDLVDRHESLRTTFDDHEGAASQRLHPQLNIPLRLERADSDLAAQLTAVFEEPFDLQRGPLMRVVVFRQGPQDHWLLVVLHHIVADGWSMGILARELSQAYRARLQGEPPGFTPLPIQYADHARWQRQWLSGERLQRHLAHWGQVLQDPPLLELPTDRPRPSEQSFRGGQLEFDWPEPVAQAARDLARRTDTTLFMVISAAYLLLLSRLSGQRDLLVGLPVAGRSRLQSQGLIGFFVNLLPLRLTLDEGLTIAELMNRVRRSALDAYDHQELPFEMLVEQFSPGRDPSRQPLVQHTVAVHNVPGGELELPGLSLESAHTQLDWVRFDLELHAWEDAGTVRGYWAYASDLFDASTIEGFNHLLQHAVLEMNRDLRAHALRLPWMNEAQDRDHRQRWNAVTPSRQEAAGALWVHEVVRRQLQASPQTLAIIQGQDRWSRGELLAHSRAVSQALVHGGLQPDERVALLTERNPWFVAGLLGIVEAGGAYVPLDPAWPPQRLGAVCAACGVHRVVCDTASLAQAQRVAAGLPPTPHPTLAMDRVLDVQELRVQHGLDSDDSAPPSGPSSSAAEQRRAVIHGGQGVYVIATSGSTGAPKPVLVTHEALANHMAWMRQTYPLEPQDRVLQRTSTTFDASVWEFWAPLMEGVPLVMAEPGLQADPLHLLDVMAEHEVTVAQFVPTVLGLVIAEPQAANVCTLRRVFAGGEALTWPLVDRLRAKWSAEVINLYGPTEVTIDAVQTRWPLQREQGERIGRPITGLRAAVVDEALRPLPSGVPGELVLGGIGLARGYLGAPGSTAERFVPDPWSDAPSQRLYRTGDRVRERSDGSLQYLGRLDRQVKFRGQRLELGEIESTLRALPGVAEALARLSGNQELVAYVVPKADALQSSSATSTASDLTPDLAQQGVQAWRSLYAEIYGGHCSAEDAAFDITGWTSSETGEPLPAEHMRAWREATVRRIAHLKPRRLFEIGCGTGLLLFPLAPGLERYEGVDFSPEVVARTNAGVQRRGWTHVQLRAQAAHEAAPTVTADIDTVVINSVAQYFPSLDYLTSVLCECAHRMAHGGRLFIGDIRHAGLLWAHHARVQLHRAQPDESLAIWAIRVRQAMLDEEELLLDPSYFEHLGALIPRLAGVQVMIKPLRDDNELARHRYDVVLHLDHAPQRPRPAVGSGSQPLRPADLAAWIEAHAEEQAWCVEPLHNGRLQAEPLLQAALREADESRTVASLREQMAADITANTSPDPQDWLDAAEQVPGLEAELGWSALGGEGQVRLHLWRPTSAAQKASPSEPAQTIHAPSARESTEARRRLAAWAHDPLAARWARALVPTWRSALAERLPSGFLPNHILCLQAWPLLPSGKLDLRALPQPARPSSEALGSHEAPQGELEQALARVWMQVLGLQAFGRHDNFFDLGGHSLLAVLLSAAISRQLGRRLSVAEVFQHPTVEAQALHLAATQPQELDAGLAEDRPLRPSSGPPVFAFPPILGWGVAFLELARALPHWQLWALDFNEDTPDPVALCVQRIERIQPTGALRLLAYSAGARLAADCMQRLQRLGREIQVLITLDGEVRPPASLEETCREEILLENIRHFEAAIADRDDVRRPYESLGLRDSLMRRMRGYLAYLDQPPPEHRLVAPVVHILSATPQEPGSEPSGLTWKQRTRGRVEIVQGHGDHADMTLPPYAAANASLIERALSTVTEAPGADPPGDASGAG